MVRSYHSPLTTHRALLLEQRQAGGEAVDEVLAADGAELALGEEAGDRNGAGLGAEDARVVVGLVKQAGAAAVAAEDQRRPGPLLVRAQVELQQGVQVLVGCRGVADVELHRLTDAHPFRHRQRPTIADKAEDVADQEIAAPEITRADRLMLAFAIPPLALVTAIAFLLMFAANLPTGFGIAIGLRLWRQHPVRRLIQGTGERSRGSRRGANDVEPDCGVLCDKRVERGEPRWGLDSAGGSVRIAQRAHE